MLEPLVSWVVGFCFLVVLFFWRGGNCCLVYVSFGGHFVDVLHIVCWVFGLGYMVTHVISG